MRNLSHGVIALAAFGMVAACGSDSSNQGAAGSSGAAGLGVGGSAGIDAAAGASGGAGMGGAGMGGTSYAGAGGEVGVRAGTSKLVWITTSKNQTYGMDETEVTRKQYSEFQQAMEQNPNAIPIPEFCGWKSDFGPTQTCLSNPKFCTTDCDNHPQTCVDWCDAYLYCLWAGKRLCGGIEGSMVEDYNQGSDSAWVNACTNDGNTTFAYGQSYDGTMCNTDWQGSTKPVKSYPNCHGMGPFTGIYDLEGNAAEWDNASDNMDGEQDNVRLRTSSYATGMGGCSSLNQLQRFDSAVDIGFRCCSRGPGEAVELPKTLTDDSTDGKGVVVIGEDLYFGIDYPAGVLKIPKGGGTPQPVGTVKGVWAMTGDAQALYVVTGNQLFRVALPDGTTTELGPYDEEVISVWLDGSTVYYTGKHGSVKAVPTTGGTPTVVIPQNPAARSQVVAAGPTEIYFGWCETGAVGKIMHAPKAGGTPEELNPQDDGCPSAMAMDAINLYWGTGGGKIFQVPLSGGTPTLVHDKGKKCPYGCAFRDLMVDSGLLYWTDEHFIAVKALSTQDPAVRYVTMVRQPTALAADSTHLFWAQYGGTPVQSILKPVAGGQ